MATAFNLVDYRTIEPVRRARLKLVEPVAAPAVEVEEVSPSAPEPKLTPPAWMVAPPFGAEPIVSVNEPQAAYRPAPAPVTGAPYQSIREVPRAAW